MNLCNVEVLDAYTRQTTKNFEYGTAGFRTSSCELPHIAYRMGILAVLRSKQKKGAIGLMITGSHNQEFDNGIKLVDPNGEMLDTSWEDMATNLANADDCDLNKILTHIVTVEDIDLSVAATVITGMDNRKSSPCLLNAALAGIAALNGTATNLGLVTTPQLHYVVVCTNTNGGYGEPTVQGYYEKILTAFKKIRNAEPNHKNYTNVLQLDTANGVGGIAAKEFQKYLGDTLNLEILNTGRGRLNHLCGADFIKVYQKPPLYVNEMTLRGRCVSIDGDADRVVYFYVEQGRELMLTLLDGDRIATLVAIYFKELLEMSGLSLQLGLVQTAYANGASTDYITNVLKVPVACVSTGVKHLHKKAMEFDIGIYFEANGHGTVVFKDTAKEAIKKHANNEALSEEQKVASGKLRDVIDMINETVGDALSDMLLVETVLHAKGWDIHEWMEIYQELENVQLKVQIKDRRAIKTTDADRRCSSPVGLQEAIDKAVAMYPRGRAFVRPSGTEDVVRVYAESQTFASDLANDVSLLVYKLAGGIERREEDDY